VTVVVTVVAYSFALCVTVPAQILATRLQGTTQSVTGAPVSGAVVVAMNDRTGWRTQALSGSEGQFVFPALPPGIYTVSVEAKGFQPVAHTNVLLGASASVSESFVLEPGTSTETAKEEAPRERLQKTESEISGAFVRRDLEVLPQLDRIPVLLSVLQPGVQTRGGDPSSSQVNGTQPGSNNLSLDGMDVNDPVQPRLGLSMTANNTDSIEQFRVITSSGAAEYGRNAGAQVMLITRPGASRWTGSAFEYFRDKVLNANDFFNNAGNIPKPRFTQNLFGFSIGGPVVKDRTLIFGNYQGRRTSQEVVRNRTVLTPVAKTGLFQWTPPGSSTASSFDIVSNDPRKLGIDPSVASVLALLPDPNNSDLGDALNTGGFRFNNPNNSDEDQLTVRVDHSLNANHRLFVRYSWERSSAVDSINGADARYPGQPQGQDSEGHWGFSVGSDWSINPQMVNQLRGGYQRAKISLDRPARVAGPMMLANSWTDPLDPSFAQWHNSPVIEITDHLALIKGNHALKAGLVFRYTSQQSHNEAGIYSDVTFGTGHGNLPLSSIGPSGSVISQTDRQRFELLYNDLLGRMEQVTQTFYGNLESFLPSGTARSRDFVFHEYGAFLQDDWKLRPSLTLNVGVRYEYSGAPSETDGIFGALDKADEISATANIADFTLLPGGSLYKKDFNNFAPRLSFAWAPWNNTKMVLRGGYAIFFDRLIGATTNFVDNNTPASAQTVSVFPNLAGTDFRLKDGIPVPAQPGAPALRLPNTRSTPVAIFNSDLRTPSVQHFDLTLQREIFRNTIVEAGYVGERGERLFMDLNLNQLKIEGDFLQAFNELQSFRSSGAPVSSTNTLVRIFGSVGAAVSAIGGSALDLGLAGSAADTVDRNYFGNYAAAGVSDFYLRNFPQYSQLTVGTNEGRSSYDSLQISVRRNSGPLKVYGNYTWSKSLDNLSMGCPGCALPLDSFNPRLNRAASDGDRPHVLNIWLVYSVPIAQSDETGADGGLLRNLLGGWDIGALYVRESGSPFSVSSGRRTARADVDSLANYTGDRRIGEVISATDGVYWFTADQIQAFTFPTAGEIGSSGVNSFRGPNYVNLDMSVQKNFRLRGDHRICFRFEVYNVFNHTNFGLPNANLSDPAVFGKIGYTQGYPRRMQAALRFEF
jgi:hypothetical protein